MKPGFLRPFHVVSQTIADMQGFLRIDGMFLQRNLKDLRSRFCGLGQTRDGHRVECIGDPESTQHSKETGIEIRDDPELQTSVL